MIKETLLILTIAILSIKGSKLQKDEPFVLSSPAFVDKGNFPKLYTCDSLGISPPLLWKNAPDKTKSFAITIHHFPKDGDKHVYMVLYNLPKSINKIEAGEKKIGEWGANTQNRSLSYSPPCSKGPGPKSYIITVYALSENLSFNNRSNAGVTMDELLSAIQNITLSKSSLELVYSR